MSVDDHIRPAASRIAQRVHSRDLSAVSYTSDLALEALLRAGRSMEKPAWSEHAIATFRGRPLQPWQNEPFTSLTYAVAEATGDDALRQHFIAESRKLKLELPRSDDGLVQHPRGEMRGGGWGVLIDSFAEYCSRLCRAAAWADDLALADDAAQQTLRHEQLLRHEGGLWRQGRGWPDDRVSLSPGTWSRGQGWLMRGFADAVVALPPCDARQTIAQVLTRLADALLSRQDERGAWHALPHRDPSESGTESSGTGLIAYGLLTGFRAGVLSDAHRNAAAMAMPFLADSVDDAGVVHRACFGPGPLKEEEPWLTQDFPPDDHHGPGCVLLALGKATVGPTSSPSR